MSECTTCGAENAEFKGFTTKMEVKTADGVVLFSVDTISNECLNCVKETLITMYGEMKASIQEKHPETVIDLFVNKDFLWPNPDDLPAVFKY